MGIFSKEVDKFTDRYGWLYGELLDLREGFDALLKHLELDMDIVSSPNIIINRS